MKFEQLSSRFPSALHNSELDDELTKICTQFLLALSDLIELEIVFHLNLAHFAGFCLVI